MPRAAKVSPSDTNAGTGPVLERQISKLLVQSSATHLRAETRALPQTVLAQLAGLVSAKPRQGRVQLVMFDGAGAQWLASLAPDQPFLTDTALMVLRRLGVTPVAAWHPVLQVERADDGSLLTLAAVRSARRQDKGLESLLLVQLPEGLSDEVLAQARKAVTAAMETAQTAVRDYPAMLAALEQSAAGIRDMQADERAFVDWLAEGHIILLGSRHYDYAGKGSNRTVQVTPGSGLGILRDESRSQAAQARATDESSLLVRQIAEDADDAAAEGGRGLRHIIISKTPERSPVHRDAAMDFVSVITRDAKGRVTGEQRFIGLWTSRAYTRHVMDIPLVQRKILAVQRAVVRAQGWSADGLKARTLINVLETWPRDELFLTDAATLQAMVTAVMELKERPEVCLLVRPSLLEQAVSVLLYVPMGRYTGRLRAQVMALLEQKFRGGIQDYRLEMGTTGSGADANSELARLLVRVQLPDTGILQDADTFDATVAEVDAELRRMIGGWENEVRDLAPDLWQRFGSGAGAGYRELTPPERAVEDFAALLSGRLVELVPADGAQADAGETPRPVQLRLFSAGAARAPLFRLVPLLADAGLAVTNEQTFHLTADDGSQAQVQVVSAMPVTPVTAAQARELETLIQRELSTAGLGDKAVGDQLNRLVLLASLTVAEVGWLRAWAAYAQQLDPGFDAARSRALLLAYPALAQGLCRLFVARLHPQAGARRGLNVRSLEQELDTLVMNLPTSAQERLARTLLQTVQAVLRTNAWQAQCDAANEAALAFKIDPAGIDALPQPRPWREIFVYHPLMEGIHLRGGKVARGGLRHSDRLLDFRTEVLGLMVAQVRKNTIIVPTGAKGGFVIKQTMPVDRAAAGAVVEQNYRRYIRALLSISDTYAADGSVLGPRLVRRTDGDDPYLVVAADKGTAKLSDVANDESARADYWERPEGDGSRGFWLGDGFATGGSIGYDHKEMGITSRGAWVSVQHHLRALEIVPSPARPLTVVGVGDMAGDVFGNGLLRDRNVQLLAAFNHVHIFLDPNPEPAASYAERQRIFEAGLGWDGYDKKLISKGGGVYLRSAKIIQLSTEMQARLGFKKREATPDEVMNAILKAPVDLIWNGGIGTFIKASMETQAAALDRANDAIRVDAAQVRALVIGEGGNLGITPKGRVELARRGVRLNTDALDNSAGVDTSDHEVNLKILLQQALGAGLLDEAGRRKLLKALTDDVAFSVLEDNRLQNLAVTLEEQSDGEAQQELLRWQGELLRRGVVDLTVDCLPTATQFAARATDKQPARYTRPELCALLAGTKSTLRSRLLQADAANVLSSAAVQPLLAAYFPPKVVERFAELIPAHRLAREIVATALANELVNRLGLLFGPRLTGDFGAQPLEAIRAAVAACALMDARRLWREIDAASGKADGKLSLAAETAAHVRVRQVAYGLAAWVLRHGQPVQLDSWLAQLTEPVRAAMAVLPTLLSQQAGADATAYAQSWRKQGFSEKLARELGMLSPLSVIPDAVMLAGDLQQPVERVLQLQLAVGEALKMPALIRRVRSIPAPDSWTRQALQAMVQELFSRQRTIGAALLRSPGQAAVEEAIATWQAANAEKLARYHLLVGDLLRQPNLSVAMLSVLIGRLRELD